MYLANQVSIPQRNPGNYVISAMVCRSLHPIHIAPKIFPFLFLICLLISCEENSHHTVVATLAGSGVMGNTEGRGEKAAFSNPMGICVDASGSIYVADANNHVIKKIDHVGNVILFAGTGRSGNADGPGKEASFFYPTAVAIDISGNLFVADTHNNRIRKIDKDGIVTTMKLAGGISLDNPGGIAVDRNGTIYVSDFQDRIVKVSADGSAVVFAGSGKKGNHNGPAGEAEFYIPLGLAFDKEGNLLVCDSFNNLIRRIDPDGNVSSLVKGNGKKGFTDGSLDSARFFHPQGIAVNAAGDIFVADAGNHRIRCIHNGIVSTLAGTGIRGATDGRIEEATFWTPTGVALDSAGNVYVSDFQNNRIRVITTEKTKTL